VRHDEQRATHWQFGADVSQRCLSSLQQHLRALSFRPPNAYRGIAFAPALGNLTHLLSHLSDRFSFDLAVQHLSEAAVDHALRRWKVRGDWVCSHDRPHEMARRDSIDDHAACRQRISQLAGLLAAELVQRRVSAAALQQLGFVTPSIDIRLQREHSDTATD